MAGSFILALGIPLVFRYSSLRNLDLVVAMVLFFMAMLWQMRTKIAPLKMGVFFILLLVGIAAIGLMHQEVFNLRNFYGQYAVFDKDQERLLASGTTIHGRQSLKPGEEQIPALYYHRQGPFGDLWEVLPGTAQTRIASIGLGIGSLLTYATPAQTWDIYELDPDIEMIAQKYFTHCPAALGTINYIFGDGRLKISEQKNPYDLIILDAFSSDAIPLHLLTTQALEIYFAALKPGGVISFHISNNYLNIIRLLASTAEAMNLAYAWKGQSIAGQGPSEWLVLEKSPHVTPQLKAKHGWATRIPWKPVRPWQDDYASILPIMSLFNTW
jgi:SAM-dependent methyltransferase